jgi:diacylglycerol kinase family enzyme
LGVKLNCIINRQSGSVPAEANAQLHDALEPYRSAGNAFVVDGDGLLETIESAVSDAPDALVVWGGDGTITCGLNVAREKQVPVLAIPGGTMNMLHERIHGPFESWKSVLRGLDNIDAPERLVGCIVNERTFYVAAMIGTLTEIAESREHLRKGELVDAAKKFVASDALDLEARLSWRPDDTYEERFAAALAVVSPEALDKPLTIARINPDSFVDLTRLAMSAFLKGWENADGVTTFRADQVLVADINGEPIMSTIDGEPVELPSRFDVEIDPVPALVLSARQ